VRRLTWLMLLVIPSVVWAQDTPQPAADNDADPSAAAVSDTDLTEPKAAKADSLPVKDLGQADQPDQPDTESLIGLVLCCGFWSVIPVVILVIFLVRRGNARKRTETLSSVAAELDLEFHPDGDEALQLQLSEFPLMNKGRKGQLTNVCAGGTDEVRLWIFDYRFITGHGKHRRVHRQTAVAMESAVLDVPEFRMRPERMFDRVGQMLGLQDIDFEGHLQFSQQFVLQSEMAEATRDFFDTGLLDFFADRPGWSFETRAGSFVVYRPRQLVEPTEFQAVFENGFACFTALRDRLERS
jgi:hypothetical protein